MSGVTVLPLPRTRVFLLYHFCRMQMPGIPLTPPLCERHLARTFQLHREKKDKAVSWEEYLDNLHALDWFLACACLEGCAAAWEQLSVARAGRSDCLLMDALRARAARFFPRNEERQESVVAEFWSSLYVPPERAGALPVLGRYDGQRPLVPWLLRVFHNWVISDIRKETGRQPLPEDEIGWPSPPQEADSWHEQFCLAARDWLTTLGERELLLLGLRLRYRLSQREVAALLKVHEGTISRRTDELSRQFHQVIGERLRAQGWTGDDLSGYIRTEMYTLLLDDPRLSADNLARILGREPPLGS